MALKLAEAIKIIDGAVAKARKLKVEVCVAVCDHEGALIALHRMDGVSIGDANYMATGKAIASVVWGVPSHECEGDANPRLLNKVTAKGWPVVRAPGGLPIRRDDTIEGACGVCGTDDLSQDEECARAGLAAL